MIERCLKRLWMVCILCLQAGVSIAAEEPLPSWNAGTTRDSIIQFVTQVTDPNHANYVPPEARIAVFDNDGTLWCEQPVYVQLAFALSQVKALRPQHPEWASQQPFQAILSGDIAAVANGGEEMVARLLAATHANVTVPEFEEAVRNWIATARHPKTGRLYTEMVYQPMLELLAYLRANGFKTYIVSGGGIDFMRPWVEQVYGIPPEQVIGSRVKVRYELRDTGPVLVKLPEVDLVNDGPGKPVGIYQGIGRRPIFACGNSDGDLQMLQATTVGAPASLGVIVHHTDADREYAYDAPSHIGQLKTALIEAKERGWKVVDMKQDWNTIYPKVATPAGETRPD